MTFAAASKLLSQSPKPKDAMPTSEPEAKWGWEKSWAKEILRLAILNGDITDQHTHDDIHVWHPEVERRIGPNCPAESEGSALRLQRIMKLLKRMTEPSNMIVSFIPFRQTTIEESHNGKDQTQRGCSKGMSKRESTSPWHQCSSMILVMSIRFIVRMLSELTYIKESNCRNTTYIEMTQKKSLFLNSIHNITVHFSLIKLTFAHLLIWIKHFT